MVTTFGFVVLAISLLHSIPNVRCQRNLEKRQESGNSVIDKFDISNSDVEINEDSIHNASLNSKGIALDAAAVTPEDVSLANRVFEFLDMDGDGALVDLELENWLMMMDIPLTPEENILEKIGDVDGDGKITYKEFEHHNNHAIEENPNDPLRFLRNLNPAQTEVPSEMASSSSYEPTENLNLHLRKKRAADAVEKVCYPNIGCFNNSLSYKNASLKPFFLPVALLLNSRLPLPDKDLQLSYDEPIRNVHKRGTVFLVHGFWSNTKSWAQEMKDELLKADDSVHVIKVDWSKGANPGLLDKFTGKWYSQAVANTRVVGAMLASDIKKEAENGVDISKIHIIGHSLGAHIAGYAGEWLSRNIDAKLGRITGMDPADPLFDGMPAAVRLDRDDAIYVDVIHTDTGNINSYGIPTPIGHADFYPNGGKNQPGCSQNSAEALATLLKGGMSCSHGRAYELMIDSIKNSEPPMLAFAADSYEQYKKSCKEAGSCKKMGYFTSTETYQDEPTEYYLDTNDKDPYAIRSTYDPKWTTWASHGGCSYACGEGTVTYTRTCEGSGMCDGDYEKTETCNLGRCQDCLYGIGEDYRGYVSKAYEEGEEIECLNWSTHANEFHSMSVIKEEGYHNYCRNPNNDPNGPWCWTRPLIAHYCSDFIIACTTNEYIGCFEDKVGNDRDLPTLLTDGLDNDIVGCIDKCQNNRYSYAGMQYSTECWCGNSAERKWRSASGCDMKCSGNEFEICGGALRNSIYKTSYDERFVGCFKDKDGKDRDLPQLVYRGAINIDWCISECKRAKYVYAGLQNSGECWCGNSAERKWGSASGCDMKCTGNSYEICGGAWTNSIYKTSYEKLEENEYPNWTHEKCTFPFEYKGKLYSGCTKAGGYDEPWCSYNAVYATGDWNWCKEQVENEYPNWTHEKCTFPFEYKYKLYSGCTKAGGYDEPWCSYNAVYARGDWNWCKEQVENEYPNWKHEKCTFPFEYKYKLYSGCTKTGGYDFPWCSYTAVFATGDDWDYCYYRPQH